MFFFFARDTMKNKTKPNKDKLHKLFTQTKKAKIKPKKKSNSNKKNPNRKIITSNMNK